MTMMRCEEMPRQLPRPGTLSPLFPFLPPLPLNLRQRPFPLFSRPCTPTFLLRPLFFVSQNVLCPRLWSLSQRFRSATWSSRSLLSSSFQKEAVEYLHWRCRKKNRAPVRSTPCFKVFPRSSRVDKHQLL